MNHCSDMCGCNYYEKEEEGLNKVVKRALSKVVIDCVDSNWDVFDVLDCLYMLVVYHQILM